MTRAEIAARVIEMADEHFDTRDTASETSEFLADLGADSLDEIEFVMELEEEFDIEIGDGHIESFARKSPVELTVGDVIDFLAARLGARG